MAVAYRPPPKPGARKRGMILCLAGVLVLVAGAGIRSFREVYFIAIADPTPGTVSTLPTVIPQEEPREGDYEQMFSHIPEEQRAAFSRQRMMVKYVFNNPEFMRTGRIPREVLERIQ